MIVSLLKRSLQSQVRGPNSRIRVAGAANGSFCNATGIPWGLAWSRAMRMAKGFSGRKEDRWVESTHGY